MKQEVLPAPSVEQLSRQFRIQTVDSSVEELRYKIETAALIVQDKLLSFKVTVRAMSKCARAYIKNEGRKF